MHGLIKRLCANLHRAFGKDKMQYFLWNRHA